MLYDPKWEKKPEVISLVGLIAWLEKQDPKTRYSYGNTEDCLLSRYFRASGFREASCGSASFTYYPYRFLPFFSRRGKIPFEMNEVARGGRTYGAALKHAREKVYQTAY